MDPGPKEPMKARRSPGHTSYPKQKRLSQLMGNKWTVGTCRSHFKMTTAVPGKRYFIVGQEATARSRGFGRFVSMVKW